jgi:Rrf2 family nitric oxide-sensitive transcriptional repressor
MNLSKHADYAIRVLLHLAIQPGRKISIASIAEEEDISRNHLMKVSHGIALAKPARGVNLGNLLQQVERNLRPLDGVEPDRPPESGKLLEQAIEDARARFIESLSHYTLADLVEDALGNRAPVVGIVSELAFRDRSNGG